MNISKIQSGFAVAASIMFGGSAMGATTYKTQASGNWSSADTWVSKAVPEYAEGANNLVAIYDGHTVTNDNAYTQWYTLNVGGNNGSKPSRYYQKGGEFASEYLTEINPQAARTGSGTMELDGVIANFNNYRLVVGRNLGNAHLIVTNSTINMRATLFMGISTAKDAPANTIDIYDSIWNASGALQIGYSSAGTNIVHLNRSILNSSAALLLGYTAQTLGAIGEHFLIAENSEINMGTAVVYMPYKTSHSAHLTISNSTFDCSQIYMGNVEYTTNYLELIASAPITCGSTSYIGYKPYTVNHVLLKDLDGENGHATVKTMMEKFSTRSVAGGTRWYDFVYDNCDWGNGTDDSNIIVSQQYNVRSYTFRNMTLPAVSYLVGYYADAPGTLVFSNCTWNAAKKSISVAPNYSTTGTLRVYDSTLKGSSLVIADENDLTLEDNMVGEVYVSGGTMDLSGELRVRRGTGRLTLDNHAAVLCNTAYFPNRTGSRATVLIDNGSSLTVTNKFTIGNQSGTYSDLTVANGGKLIVKDADCKLGSDCANFALTMSGADSLIDTGLSSFNFTVSANCAGTANLNGGTIRTASFGDPKATASQQIVFNGATVEPTKNTTLFAATSQVSLGAGGMTVNLAIGTTNSIYAAVAHNAGEGVPAIDGGITLDGDGQLDFRAAMTYTGPTVVKGGVLKLCVNEALPANTTIDCRGGRLNVLTNVEYPEGITFNVANLDYSSGSKHVIAHNWSADRTPSVTGLADAWNVERQSNGDLVVFKKTGFMILVK